jgi:hypothetical protein
VAKFLVGAVVDMACARAVVRSRELARYKQVPNTVMVAVKMLKATAPALDRVEFIRECEAMFALNHPNLLSIIGVSVRRRPVTMATMSQRRWCRVQSPTFALTCILLCAALACLYVCLLFVLFCLFARCWAEASFAANWNR